MIDSMTDITKSIMIGCVIVSLTTLIITILWLFVPPFAAAWQACMAWNLAHYNELMVGLMAIIGSFLIVVGLMARRHKRKPHCYMPTKELGDLV
jgi:hypothetical protein